ncbi:DNA ligase 1 isoform X2 [Brachypodium distachyon]|uniref:Ribosomal RNA-processing protein 7 C-terminal domain-containing protein n=1 Tax=Brachypodium distachyon TaxID=15368 RepID=A0A0Q3IMN4_BRADI|nr:DNA ligase 1 isoform X2 [Brachypodium distachyon]KQK01500.1 hypothetical protein BRADI_3g56230v3 [Brachypodium distachyon]|eukprot:XP_010236000.1 DNA ligase 1 isoform X2 [Brachypodium distachyon]
MGKSKDKKVSREAKVDKKLALGLGVKRKQLKKKKDRVLDGAVEREGVAERSVVKDKKLVGSKKIVLKEKKKTKHVKVTSRHTKTNDLVSVNKDEATPKLKKKNKKQQLNESHSPVEVQTSPLDSNDAGALKPKKKKKKVREGKGLVEPNDAEDILHENQEILAGETEVMDIGEPENAKRGKKNKTKKVKRSGKVNRTDRHASTTENNLERNVEVDVADVDEIPSVNEDFSRGMNKWILEYRQKRPGLKVLQQRIDEFITLHEEQQEKEKKEKEEAAAKDGWTVVVHHKGRKKTTEAETGTAVGSVSLASMQEKFSKKKPKEVGQNFYRFQKREAQMTELAMLQSKFEQDKKRIQQLRAQRKFKPY